MVLSRRRFLQYSSGVAATALVGCNLNTKADASIASYDLTAGPKDFQLLPGRPATKGLGYRGDAALPILRVRQGQPLRVALNNQLGEVTTIHWHGLRLPNPMDGVPYLTQKPIADGETFVYEFTPPDAGSFWFHPHANSLQQAGRGLAGALIVDEAEPVGFDEDLPLIIKDWVVDEDTGQFTELTTPKGAARAGTFGNVRTVNGEILPRYNLPAGGWVRLRLFNVDVTRIYKVMLKGDDEAEAQIIAMDGMPLATPRPLSREAIGPGMRVDLAVHVPEREGAEFWLQNTSTSQPWTMAHFTAVAVDKPVAKDRPKLPVNPIPAVDLQGAPVIPFRFDTGFGSGYAICGGSMSREYPVYWTVNNTSLPQSPVLMPPLATLKRGQTAIFELHNNTPHSHPIHLHGYSFTILDSNKQEIDPYHADTVLLSPKERVRFAFLADNPGAWMYHCHIIEHQESGMSGNIQVS